jgi:uncharacterized OsmC-like protein
MATTYMLNGVNVEKLNDTIAGIRSQPALAEFTFRLRNRWLHGGHNRSLIQDFYGAGQEDESRDQPFVLDNDEPAVLLGEDFGPSPVEQVLHGLAGCLTTSLTYHAAAKGIRIDEVHTKFEGDLDLRGFLGLDDSVRNGFSGVRVHFTVRADAPEDTIRELVDLAQRRSPVYDIVTNRVPVSVTADVTSSSQ